MTLLKIIKKPVNLMIMAVVFMLTVIFGVYFSYSPFFKFNNVSLANGASVTTTWVGNTTGNWSDAGNWDNGVPNTETNVLISSSTAVTVTADADLSFADLTIGGGSASTTLVLTNNISAGTNILIDVNGTFRQNNSSTQSITGNLTVASGGLLTHTANATEHLYSVSFSTNNITIASGGKVDVDGMGYDGGDGYHDGSGPGAGKLGGSGGGHGGDGGVTSVAVAGGDAYCDSSNPNTIGSGGGGNGGWWGEHGGGLIKFIAVDTITINGTITADGKEAANHIGGAAGGGIKLSADTITGTPQSFTIIGSNGLTDSYGGGGGGCALVEYYTTTTIVEGSVNKSGGTGNGSGGEDGVFVLSFMGPTAPTSLYVHSSNAQSGGSNPVDLSTLSPVFSAICESESAVCASAYIEVDDDSDFSSLVWDSTEIVISDTANDSRSSDITYDGGQLFYNTTYYWRIKFVNSYGVGLWSDGTDTFFVPRSLELINFNDGGDVQQGQIINIEWLSYQGENDETVKMEYSIDDFSSATEITASADSVSSTSTIRSYAWTIPNISSSNVKIRISSNNDGNNFNVTSTYPFAIQSEPAGGILFGRSFTYDDFYSLSADSISFNSGQAVLTPEGWYNADWSKRRAISIVNNVASELTDFQVFVTTTYDSDMQADFDDLRFTASDGETLLDYWLESKTDSVTSTLWVEVPTLAASASTNIYMYYGNAEATSVSSIDDTFLFGDDFDDDSLDTSIWTTTAVAPSESSGLLTSAPTQGVWATNYAMPDQTILEAYGKANATLFGRVAATKSTNKFENELSGDDKGFDIMSWGGTRYFETNSAEASSGSWNTSYNRFKMVFLSGASVAFTHGAVTYTSTTNVPVASDGIHPEIYSHATDSMVMDWIFVRKYASSEPIILVGDEEASGGEASSQTINFHLSNSYSFSSVSSFSATTTATGAGAVKFQISNDGGSTWYYCDGSSLMETELGYAESNSEEEITDACLENLAEGTFNVKVYLYAGLGETVSIDSVSFLITDNVAPEVSVFTPIQSSASVVTATTTISDTDSDATSLTVQYSTNTINWSSATLKNVTQDPIGAIATSSGSISNINTTSTGSAELTIEWDVLADLPDTETSTVYLKFTPNDGSVNGTATTSLTFNIDTAKPTQMSDLTASSVSTSSLSLVYPTTTSTDTNFVEYKIYYSSSTPVLTTDASITSSTDANLGNSSFNDLTSYSLTDLSPNTVYYFSIYAYDTWGYSTSSVFELSTTTLANIPGVPTVDNPSVNSLDITIDINSNPDNATFAVYNYTSGNYLAADGSSNDSSAVYQTASNWGAGNKITAIGLSANTAYQFVVTARNGDNVITDASSVSVAVYTLASAPSSISANVDSASQITLSFSGNATQYYAENITAGANSGWTSASSYQFSNLACSRAYTFRVKGKNAVGTETSFSSSISATTMGCAGSPPPAPPAIVLPVGLTVPIAIETPSSYSTQNSVNFFVSNAKYMAISTDPDFYGISWVPYESRYQLDEGQTIVYAKFMTEAGGVSSVYMLDLFDQIVSNHVSSNNQSNFVEQTQINASDEKSSGQPVNNNSNFSYTFTNYLYLGDQGEEVKQLQIK
ncbi:MAG: hypothetical protein COU31_03730, partial [Candidatus Magasanikbacteria bacterium CG10_big_fil_rev_8_21_14_0_10_40_10]